MKMDLMSGKVINTLRVIRDRFLIQGTALFDAAWYRSHYPDVAQSGIDPIMHYLEHGYKEGRDPGPLFSTEDYYKANPDVFHLGVDPLLHYIRHGKKEGRVVRPVPVEVVEPPLAQTAINSGGVDYLSKWLVSTEKKYGGLVKGIKKRKISDEDPRTQAELEQVGLQGGDRMSVHGYADKYARYLLPFVLRNILDPHPITLIEVGILKGTGLATWSDLFPGARIIGLDLDLSYFQENMSSLRELGAFTVRTPELLEFDQFKDNSHTVKALLGESRIDICIDDGMHTQETIINTLNTLLPYMAEEFVYFVEDNPDVHSIICSNYPDLHIDNYNELTVITRKHTTTSTNYVTPVEPELSDIEWTQKRFQEWFNKPLDLTNPVTFIEKINAYKVLYREKPLALYCDKFSVKDYVKLQVGEAHVIPTLACFENVEEINLADLPDRFVMKATHGSGWNIFCHDKSKLDWDKCKADLCQWMAEDLYMRFREWSYKGIKPRIIVEPLLLDAGGKLPRDYKFFCYDGDVKYVYVVSERETSYYMDFFDLSWSWLPIRFGYKNSPNPPTRPEKLAEMAEVAHKLSTGFPFVRVDLYSIPDVYFGEMTFYPQGGCVAITPEEWDLRLGSHMSTSSFIRN